MDLVDGTNDGQTLPTTAVDLVGKGTSLPHAPVAARLIPLVALRPAI